MIDGVKYLSGTGGGIDSQTKTVREFLGSGRTFQIAYVCIASHGSREPFPPTTLSSGVGGGMWDKSGNKRGFTYSRVSFSHDE